MTAALDLYRVGARASLPELIVERTPRLDLIGCPGRDGLRRQPDGRLAETIRVGHGASWWRVFETRGLPGRAPYWSAHPETGGTGATGEPGCDLTRGWRGHVSLESLLYSMRRVLVARAEVAA